jgi:hypothetical protein
MYASNSGRFRCTACGTWLQYKLGSTRQTWLSKQLKRPAALFVVPLAVALLVVAVGTGAIVGLSRIDDTSLLLLCAVMLLVAAAYDVSRSRARLASATLEVAELQSKQLSTASLQNWLGKLLSGETLHATLRALAFFAQLGFYLWAIPKAIMWAVAHAA